MTVRMFALTQADWAEPEVPRGRVPSGPGRFVEPRPAFNEDPVRPWLRRVQVNPLVWEQFDGTRIIVPVGFVFDGATIPQGAWSLMGHPFDHQVIQAACLHDLECDYRYGSHSSDSHARFRHALGAAGVGRVRRSLMWAAVRTFGPRW